MRPNFISFPGKIILISSDQDLRNVDFKPHAAFGFDTETKPSFKKGDNFKTALLQLATDSVAYVIRLHHIRQFDSLRGVLEDPALLKVGAAISRDLKELQRIFPFQPRGFVELQDVAKEKGLENRGLKGMTQEVLQASLSKGAKMTNWERNDLTPEQLMYAATDAWIGLTIYQKLIATQG